MDITPQDPRHLNDMFDDSSIDAYKLNYANALKAALEGVSSAEIDKLCQAILRVADAGGQILVAGNGGSAAIAEHLCCDWTKGTSCEGHNVINTRSMTSNVALYTAIANDYGFENVFGTQLDFFGREGDLLIAISSSGNSPNILNAVTAAKDRGMFVAGFSGFSGGKLKDMVDASIYVGIDNYGIVEDAHQAVMHVIAQYIAGRRDKANAEGKGAQ